ncbi:MAG: VWA domain-containing protein, partial [Silicimonas sp.]|nr:VWA domain-containing protein [Silicimonas sp.]
GSLTIFSLFLFILLLMISGMAVDMVMHERQRVHMQNTLDSAILAAGSLDSGATTEAEMTAMVNDYVAKAGIDPSRITVTPRITGSSSRTISATGRFEIDTIFMGLMGINEMHGGVGGAAEVGEEKVEIVLVLDVSGSMGRDGKIEALRPAAKDFVTEIISKLGADRVSFSVVPYNHQVHVDDDLRSRLDWDDTLRTVLPANVAPYPGAITTYAQFNPSSRCARFREADFRNVALTDTTRIEGSAMFSGLSGRNLTAYASYPVWADWCSDSYSRVVLYQNNETDLHNYIDTLQGEGWTSIDYGMNWGVGILGSAFTPIVQDMVDNNILHPDMAGHPMAFTEPDVKKIVVLMTDGINTDHLDLDDQFKSGPSRVWYSDTLANGSEYMGFLVEMPSNGTNQRWFVPGSPLSSSDDSYLAESALPSDAVQWDYHAVYDRFRPEDVGRYFFANDAPARAAHDRARIDVGSNGIADTRVRNICSEARTSGIDIYTIAFQAPTASETLLRDCAAKASHYFDVNGLDIANAFNAIAVDLTKLKLTQ